MPINLPVRTNGIGKTHPDKPLCQRVFAHATEIGGLMELSATHGLGSFVTFLAIKKSKMDIRHEKLAALYQKWRIA